MLSCQECVEGVYEYLDGELDQESAERIREHLEMCKRCYPYFNFERIFLDHIRSHGGGREANKTLEARIRNMLAEID